MVSSVLPLIYTFFPLLQTHRHTFTPKQRKIKFKPQSKLNNDIYIQISVVLKESCQRHFWTNRIWAYFNFPVFSSTEQRPDEKKNALYRSSWIFLKRYYKAVSYTNIKTQSATIAFFLFASFLSPRYVCFFQKTCLFGLLSVKRLQFRQVRFQKSG